MRNFKALVSTMNTFSCRSVTILLGSVLGFFSLQAQTLTKSDIRIWLKGQAVMDEDQTHDWSEKSFFMLAGEKAIYTAEDLRAYKPPPAYKPPAAAESGKAGGGWKPIKLKVRENFDDVLATEDPSQDGKPDASDINGASFSFTRDLIDDADTWQGKGSIIMPLIWQGSDKPDADWHLDSGGLMPSISLEKLVTEGDANKESDSLVYRIGGFLNFGGPLGKDNAGRMENHLRGYFSYGTDTNHHVSIPAAEIEWEPRFDWGAGFTIGHWRALRWRKGYDPASADFSQSENALIAYQWRILLKAQAGEVSDAGDVPDLETGPFLRLGPVTELKFDPFFLKRLTLSARYQYLTPIDGPDASPDRFDASLAWTLWQRTELNQRVSVKATYINGPLDFRDEDVESLLIGLAVTF